MLGWDFSVTPKSLSTDFADYPDEIEQKRFHPDEISATKISRGKHLTGQVEQAQIYED